MLLGLIAKPAPILSYVLFFYDTFLYLAGFGVTADAQLRVLITELFIPYRLNFSKNLFSLSFYFCIHSCYYYYWRSETMSSFSLTYLCLYLVASCSVFKNFSLSFSFINPLANEILIVSFFLLTAYSLRWTTSDHLSWFFFIFSSGDYLSNDNSGLGLLRRLLGDDGSILVM